MINYISLCSGMAADKVAWEDLPMNCVAFAENNKFASRLLQYRYPGVPNLGDVKKITNEHIAALGPVEMVVAGFPCQDISSAGKRAGFGDEITKTRSGLFYDCVRIFRASGARLLVLENVYGIYSCRAGKDFAAVVATLCGCEFDVPNGGWQNAGFAAGPNGLFEWATLDARYFGVPQQRRRMFAVFDSGNWAGRGPLLLDAISVSGHTKKSRAKEAGFARSAAQSAGIPIFDGVMAMESTQGRARIDYNASPSLNASHEQPVIFNTVTAGGKAPGWADAKNGNVVFGTLNGGGKAAGSLSTQDAINGNVVITGPLQSSFGEKGNGGLSGDDASFLVAPSLQSSRGSHGGPGTSADDAEMLIFRHAGVTDRSTPSATHAQTITTDVGNKVSVFQNNVSGSHSMTPKEESPALGTNSSKFSVHNAGAIRRITPIEAERLMGFPDNYTLIPVRPVKKVGKAQYSDYRETDGRLWLMAADGPRYRVCGNSWAVPCIKWVGEQLIKLFQ